MAFPTGWKSHKITIQANRVDGTGNHIGLPVPIRLSHLKSEMIDGGVNSALNGGGDLRITSDAEGKMRLPLDVVEFVTSADPDKRKCHLWTLPVMVSSTKNTELYIWYNMSGEVQPQDTDPYGRFAVWANEEVVLITENQGNNIFNRTGKHPVKTVGKFENAGPEGLKFDGYNTYLSIADHHALDFMTEFSLRAYIDNVSGGEDYPQIIAKEFLPGADYNPYVIYGMDIYPNSRRGILVAWASQYERLHSATENPDKAVNLRDGQRHYVVGVYDNVAMNAYVDGVLTERYNEGGGPIDTSIYPLLIGASNTATSDKSLFKGNMPVVFVRGTKISGDRVRTEYNMLSSPETFIKADDAESGTSKTDFKTQHLEDDIPIAGAKVSYFESVSSLSNAIELANNNRMTTAGPDNFTDNEESDDLAGARVLTGIDTLTYYREPNAFDSPVRFNSTIWEYTGRIRGPNEFIVRGRYVIDLFGKENSVSQPISNIENADKCVPFITGIMNDSASDDADSSTAIAYLENNRIMRVEKGSDENKVQVYITLVEFTGSNWTILHGDSGPASMFLGEIKLYDRANGTGEVSSVSDWSQALIIGQHRGDKSGSVNNAVADNWPLFLRGDTNQTVKWLFHYNHMSYGTNRHFVHVLNNPQLNVTRYSDISDTEGETVFDISSAGLQSLSEALIVGFSISFGKDTSYGRGWRNYYFKSPQQVAHWCHRSSPEMTHEIQIVDLSGLKGEIEI